MKPITVSDCEQLEKDFRAYCERAEQYQFALLSMIDVRLTATIRRIKATGTVDNQKDMRAMFRVILKTIGKDYSQYEESEEI